MDYSLHSLVREHDELNYFFNKINELIEDELRDNHTKISLERLSECEVRLSGFGFHLNLKYCLALEGKSDKYRQLIVVTLDDRQVSGKTKVISILEIRDDFSLIIGSGEKREEFNFSSMERQFLRRPPTVHQFISKVFHIAISQRTEILDSL